MATVESYGSNEDVKTGRTVEPSVHGGLDVGAFLVGLRQEFAVAGAVVCDGPAIIGTQEDAVLPGNVKIFQRQTGFSFS